MKPLVFLIISIIGFNSLYAQNQEVLFTIEDSPITVDDFRATYLKNTANAVSKESLDSYFNLFVNFKLKVHEAKQQKIDTSKQFREEYEGYIKQLAQPYLTDIDVNQKLIDEAYERLSLEIHASHILINVPATDDTLKYYQKAIDARNRIISGEPFEKVALETSNDPSVSRNKGSLGYFTAFQMVYPFESAAFNTPKGEISMPARTQFGYHIIKVHDIRPSQGKVKIAHIMIKTQPNETDINAAHDKIVAIQNRLQNGEDFGKLAKDESQDPGTAANNGEFPWISSGQIIPDIERVAFSLPSNGSISAPFRSPYGWHIVKLIDRKMIGSKDEMLHEIKNKISRDTRSFKSKESFIEKLKAEYGYTYNDMNLNMLAQKVDSSVYSAKWQVPTFNPDANLFTLADKSYKQSDFAEFIAQNQRMARNTSIQKFVYNAYNEWVNQQIVAFEETQLQRKYPEFSQLQQEYYEGMMLFEITNRMVWSKSTDSTTIANFYTNNKENYKWGQRIHYVIYSAQNPSVSEKMKKLLQSGKTSKLTPTEFATTASKKLKTNVTFELKTSNTDNPEVKDYLQWENGTSLKQTDEGNVLVFKFLQTTTGDIKELNDCKGEVTADLQVELDNKWIELLKQKYKVEINTEAFDRISKELK